MTEIKIILIEDDKSTRLGVEQLSGDALAERERGERSGSVSEAVA